MSKNTSSELLLAGRTSQLLRLGILASGLALLLMVSALAVGGEVGRSPARKVAARLYETPAPTPRATPTATPGYVPLSWAQIAWILQALATPTPAVPVAPQQPPASAPGESVAPASAPQQPVSPLANPPSPTLLPPTAPSPAPTVFVPPTPTPTPDCPTASMDSMATSLFNEINNQRAQAGVPALALNPCVVFVAQYRADDMATNNYFSHTSPDGGGAFTLLDQHHVAHGWAGENLARNNYPPDEAVGIAIHDLMASPGHRDNILATHFTMLGVGYAYDGVGMHYLAMVFIGPP